MTTHPESPDGVETAKRGKPSCDLRKRASTKRSSPVVLGVETAPMQEAGAARIRAHPATTPGLQRERDNHGGYAARCS